MKTIWIASPWTLSPLRGSVNSYVEWPRFIRHLKELGVNCNEVLLFVSIAMDHIWLTRNAAIHYHSVPDVNSCLRRSDELMLVAMARNHEGVILFAVTSKTTPKSPLVEETYSTILALTEAAKRKIPYYIIDGDS
ncbi:hypothetical protein TorRG33x02_341250 [Trema orientale]|uniref:Uncharacterized protein n=1 Tax=Trema orientale TaxID=63057 RepID=A0A2P5AU71_TREOI|nr:hypothetical protein TorRG33x02_341250 [Trema orientale]